jgi:hypothetical protein
MRRLKLRGQHGHGLVAALAWELAPRYNVIEITGSHVDIWRRHPFHGQERIIQFSTDTFEYEKYTGRIESR